MTHHDETTPPDQFIRGIGPAAATSLVVGSMIGSGIFIVSADISRQVAAWGPGGLLLVWVLTGLMTLAGALSYAELAAMLPKAGGQYVFLRDGLAPVETTQVGVDHAPNAHDIASTFGDGSIDANVNGKVRIRTYACLAWQRSFCTTCSERCPERAIVVEQGKPRVEEERCTGCGQCVRLCPAPVNGFDIIPNDPEPPLSEGARRPAASRGRSRSSTTASLPSTTRGC